MKQQGQVILVLILVMTVALSIGLSIVQKSLVDVSTSSRVEQSSRAFSAAESGIEQALGTGSTASFSLPNDSSVTISDIGSLPATAAAPNRQEVLEVGSLSSPLSKEDVGQVWLADPDPNVNLPACSPIDPLKHTPVCYNPSPSRQLDVYWGNSSTDQAALALTLVYYDGTSYQSRKWYLDHASTNRDTPNGFDKVLCSGNYSLTGYQCFIRLGDSSVNPVTNGPLPSGLMLLRARLLYNVNSQPFAVQAVGTCGTSCSLPPQTRILTSIGTSGRTQRKIQLFQHTKVVPPFFDYALFSAGDINK